MVSPQIIKLAQSIAQNTAIVNDFLLSKGIPPPSFDVDAPSESPVPQDTPPGIEAARVAVVDATLELHDLMLGPRDYLMSYTVGSPSQYRILSMPETDKTRNKQHDELIGMQAISRFGIAKSFPVGEEATFETISKACNLDESITRRLLRYAMTQRIFHEPRKNVVAHTAASKLLAEDQVFSDWVGVSTDELWQAAAQTLNAMVKSPNSQEPNETVRIRALKSEAEQIAHEVRTGVRTREQFGEIHVRDHLAGS